MASARTYNIKILIISAFLSLFFCSFLQAASPRWSVESEAKQFIVTAYAKNSTVPIGDYHQWIVHIEDKFGNPLDRATLTIDGGMAAHGHGLPSQPMVDKYMGNGEYLVDGMLFNMAGEWTLRFAIGYPGGSDVATLALVLKH